MSKYLCTFTGKFGDILWSLPTAKYIAERVAGQSVDFAMMPYYKSLLPLLVSQTYIENAFVAEDWLRTHSNHGDQPWQPPEWVEKGGPLHYDAEQHGIKTAQVPYDKCWHLTYRGHPGITAPSMPLVDFIAYQQGISFNGYDPVPFLDVDESVEEEARKIHFTSGPMLDVIKDKRLVTYNFNEQYAEQKQKFLEALWAKLALLSPEASVGFELFNVGEVGWKEAAWLIKKSLVYVGCRSANWVVANGVGQQTITFEPHPSRHAKCHLGTVFGNPYGKETALPFGLPEAVAADVASSLIRKMREAEFASVT
jgi:hypothetical protein